MRSEDIAWRPTPDTIAEANLTRFIAACGRRDYDDLLAWAIAEPESFHRKLLDHIDYRFFEPYEAAMDASAGIERRAGASAAAPTSRSTASTNGGVRRRRKNARSIGSARTATASR